MLRIDSRNIDRCPNALLHCKQKHYWKVVAEAEEKQPPQGDLSVAINIDCSKKKLDFKVNDQN
ncbi:MAG: hypothetical protein V3U02_07550 [Calditrichia bacterium]